MLMNTRLVFARFLAIVVLVIPGLMAMKGFLMMKDALFLYYAEHGNELISPGFTVAFLWRWTCPLCRRYEFSGRLDLVP